MTKRPFVGQSAIANSLLDLIHTDVCGPLNTWARGGYSYFITFTNDHSQYGYIYLMRHKFEVFGRFEEYKLEVENRTGRKIKTVRSDRREEYLSVDPPKGVRPVGCKWVYKRKLGAEGEVTAFKARLVEKGYTQRPGFDFKETYSPVAMAKSIQILLVIAACDVSFQSDNDDAKSQSSFVFKLNGGVVA
ncbi:UNVERIFIED_CONTAM: Retrovirus-related Pol polyprotein from transposon RE2 [Sesamum calycinum]|uniref:Retrovirus-related Pol polyprotein from transposon RE2 n=1 Tax=Sesamum calycinum TaxID=2727403 RepID=A0AAW2SHG4_9LAMI